MFCQKNHSGLLRKMDITISSDITLCTASSNQLVTLSKIFKFGKKEDLVSEKWGYWTKEKKTVVTQIQKIMLRRRNNFNNITLNTCIVVLNNDSLSHLTDKRQVI